MIFDTLNYNRYIFNSEYYITKFSYYNSLFHSDLELTDKYILYRNIFVAVPTRNDNAFFYSSI